MSRRRKSRTSGVPAVDEPIFRDIEEPVISHRPFRKRPWIYTDSTNPWCSRACSFHPARDAWMRSRLDGHSSA